MGWSDGLTEKQRRFCEVYSSNGGNASDAARQAGYKSERVQGAQNLTKLSIRKALELLRKETTSKAIMTREERQTFWTDIALGRVGEVQFDGDGNRTETPAQMKDRLKASELLAKSQADFIERREITGKDGAPLIPSIKIGFIGSIGRGNGKR